MGTCIDIVLSMISSRKVSEVPTLYVLSKTLLPADLLHCFNFFTVSIRVLLYKTKMEYLKLELKVVPAYSNVKRPI